MISTLTRCRPKPIFQRHAVAGRAFLKIPGLANGKVSHKRLNFDQEYHIKKKLNHPQDLLYDIIQDVAKYQEFIPYCTRSFINEYDQITKVPTKGGFRVGFQRFDEEFTCDLICTPNSQVISKSIPDSLFQELYSEWNITRLNEKQSEINLILKYDFKSKLYNSVSSMFAQKISQIMLKAFDERAAEIRKKGQR